MSGGAAAGLVIGLLILVAIIAVLANERRQGAVMCSTFATVLKRTGARDDDGAGSSMPASVNPVFDRQSANARARGTRSDTTGSSASYLEPGVGITGNTISGDGGGGVDGGVDGGVGYLEPGVGISGESAPRGSSAIHGGGRGNAPVLDEAPQYEAGSVQYQPVGLDLYGEVIPAGSGANGSTTTANAADGNGSTLDGHYGDASSATAVVGGGVVKGSGQVAAQYEYVDAETIIQRNAESSGAHTYVVADDGEAQYAIPMEEETYDVGVAAANGKNATGSSNCARPAIVYAVPIEDGDEAVYHVSPTNVYGEYGDVAAALPADATPFNRKISVYAGFAGDGVYESSLTDGSNVDTVLARKPSVYAGFGGGDAAGSNTVAVSSSSSSGGAAIIQVYGSAGESSSEDEGEGDRTA